jgi:small subunit ribosomal protein S7
VERFNKEQDETKRNNIETNPLKIFLTALDNCKPLLKLEPVNRGGITYQCPMPMSERESEFRSIKFILTSANDKDRNVRFYDSLSNELLDAYQFQVKNNSNFYSNMQKKFILTLI